ncbi:MAG: TolC family protein [Thermodesulfobacteriota bacterium]
MYLFFTLLLGLRLFFSLVALVILASPVNSLAAAEAGEINTSVGTATAVTLDGLIAAGLRDSPAIKAKRLAWESVKERYPQARSLPDPMLTYTQPFQEIETRLGPIRRSFMLSQRVPYPGKLRLKGEVVYKDVEIARIALDSATRDLVLDVKKAYYDLYYLDKAKALAGERIELFDHFSRAEMNDYSVGAARFSDVVSAETRFADAEYDLILFAELRRGVASRLNTLLGRDPEFVVPTVAEPVIEEDMTVLEELYRLAGENEDIRAAEIMIEKSELKKKLSTFSSKPNFMVGFKYTEVGNAAMPSLSDGGRDAVAVTFGLTLPLWGKKNRAARAEANLAHLKSAQTKSALDDGLNAKVKKAYVDLKSNYQLVRLYSNSLLPKAEKLISTVEINYKNGNGSIADLFESKVMWINFSLAYHRAASNYLKNRADLERLTSGFALEDRELADLERLLKEELYND